jgi:hypothetical protein
MSRKFNNAEEISKPVSIYQILNAKKTKKPTPIQTNKRTKKPMPIHSILHKGLVFWWAQHPPPNHQERKKKSYF